LTTPSLPVPTSPRLDSAGPLPGAGRIRELPTAREDANVRPVPSHPVSTRAGGPPPGGGDSGDDGGSDDDSALRWVKDVPAWVWVIAALALLAIVRACRE
jgi:hypothetical protein